MALDQIFLNEKLYDYLLSVSMREPDVLRRLREETKGLKMSFWQIPAIQGQFMMVLVRLMGAKRVLEIGTFTGYSSTSMALAMPADGRILAIDISDEYTRIARKYWQEAGVASKIELRLGPGIEQMDALIEAGRAEHFDLCFIDADKVNYQHYYERALKLVRKGGLILIDNTLFSGRVVGQNLEGLAQWQLDWTEDVKRFNAALLHDKRVTISMIPVGDGMTLAIKE
ncbi:MAG: class I SAM-dependent methyltransferase [Alphaproteobacteria bacterium]